MMAGKIDLIDTIDQLSEARDLIEAALMAVEAVTDKHQRNALARLLGTIAERLTDVGAKLDARLEGGGK
ncbi:hypothetical protein WH91_01725 [Devosia psychrophila]|uniref:Uncharacterized protein n=1 Tax=Devosia psychrophila TaxID=728005 RepID=A0A0F5Q105_9HYPH|nr:hypothetical protein WH91_01725 [Devosia psychrophila]SFD00278.1 hypothetical protein SAMN04488059_11725 [Devosia psychrophila]